MPADYLLILLTAVVAGAGAYFGSYLKKKGENLATHEDVDKLVNQVAVVTVTTREIEAKISNDVWERQRKWEVKRDALFEALKDIASMEDCLGTFIATFKGASQAAPGQQTWENKKAEAVDLYNKHDASLARTLILATLVCTDEVRDKFLMLKQVILLMFNLAVIGKPDEASKAWPEFTAKLLELESAIRRELSMSVSVRPTQVRGVMPPSERA